MKIESGFDSYSNFENQTWFWFGSHQLELKPTVLTHPSGYLFNYGLGLEHFRGQNGLHKGSVKNIKK
jgi:hypothetical protein